MKKSFLLAGIFLCAAVAWSFASAPKTSNTNPAVSDDGSHDFDFEIGTWKTHVKRLMKPLAHSSEWADYDGQSVVRPIWNGKANLLELTMDGSRGHFQGLSLRLFNPDSRQWSLSFVSAGSGTLGAPSIGDFNGGRGEFYDQETFGGRAVMVRFVISDIKKDSVHFEQAFSNDGGKTWEVNWIADDVRVSESSQ